MLIYPPIFSVKFYKARTLLNQNKKVKNIGSGESVNSRLCSVLFAVPSRRAILIGERSPKNSMNNGDMLPSGSIVIGTKYQSKRDAMIDHVVSCLVSGLDVVDMVRPFPIRLCTWLHMLVHLTVCACVGTPCFGVLLGYLKRGYHIVHCWREFKDFPK
jgi:hypothetical protein